MDTSKFLQEIVSILNSENLTQEQRVGQAHTYCWMLGRNDPSGAKKIFDSILSDLSAASKISGMSEMQCSYVATRLMTTTAPDRCFEVDFKFTSDFIPGRKDSLTKTTKR
jgi:hypothetical protein